MEISRKWRFSYLFLGLFLLATALQGVQGDEESEAPSQCKPFIEKALKEQLKDDAEVSNEPPGEGISAETEAEADADASQDVADDKHDASTEDAESEQGQESSETQQDQADVENATDEEGSLEQKSEQEEQASAEETKEEASKEEDEEEKKSVGQVGAEAETDEEEAQVKSAEEEQSEDEINKSDESVQKETAEASQELSQEETTKTESKEDETTAESAETDGIDKGDSAEIGIGESKESIEKESSKDVEESTEDKPESAEDQPESSKDQPESNQEASESAQQDDDEAGATDSDKSVEKEAESVEGKGESVESTEAPEETGESAEKTDTNTAQKSREEELGEEEKATAAASAEEGEGDSAQGDSPSEEGDKEGSDKEEGDGDSSEVPEEDLIQEIEIPNDLRPRDHIEQLMKLDDSYTATEAVLNKISETTLKELKRIYENAIKPLETLYKYRDLSNRHYGDAEIFSKPLILFMGPWSGGKSSIINYLVDNEYNSTSLRTGAEPSPAYFNLLMYGDEPEFLDGTQLAADFTFAGLQKFGQGLEERLRGLKLPSKLLEKVNIVEIPGILEVRKQVSRVFPFNDACQWFIDRADIIFLVYDPSKLDVGPETEAILDQLKGREHQTRIVLNKADQVKPEELMRVQSALIWNISPLMSSAQPPIMYTTSLWSRPYESWAPVRLLQAQERAFLRDLRSAIDKRIDNKISSARRFAVRVRNHAKMVDCYLTTYYNHKSVFGNRKQVSDQIIEHPQDYHIYEGLSTLTNISRYDLPDPDIYRDFFRLNPLYDFQQLSATCTYFRGCPINRLDVAIAYDLPELVGKHKKLVESAVAEIKTTDS